MLHLRPCIPSEFRLVAGRTFHESTGQLSPDGTWVADASNESGPTEIYAAPFPGSGGKRQISAGGRTNPRWGADGKEIFYVTTSGRLMAAEVTARAGTLEVGRLHTLFGGISTAVAPSTTCCPPTARSSSSRGKTTGVLAPV